MNDEIYYKKKYLKYKIKYLNLKGGNIFGNMLGSFTNMVSMNSYSNMIPYQNMGIANNYTNIYTQLLQSGLLTPDNKKIIIQLLSNTATHFLDPTFYPIMISIFEDIILLAGSTETLAIPVILSTIAQLWQNVNLLKMKYPQDFILIRTFLLNNRDKILNLINRYGNYQINQQIYNFFTFIVS